MLAQLRVLHQTERFAIVAKPAGCVVHRDKYSPADEVPLLQRVRDQLGRHVHPVHRLDGGTSGCVLFAFDSATTALLQEAMSNPSAQKTYLAMVRGDASHIRDMVVNRCVKDADGYEKDAQTHFDCVAACSNEISERSSLLVATPLTGRWHQIRKHLNGLSHPILGDAKHGDSRVNRWWRQHYDLKSLGLHCERLQLQTRDGELIDVRCPVRADLVDVWRGLPWWDEACAALPELRSDAAIAAHELVLEAAAEDPWGRAAAAGSGRIAFARRISGPSSDQKPHHPKIRYFCGQRL
jgi:tRNA pseudouridine65 synthase